MSDSVTVFCLERTGDGHRKMTPPAAADSATIATIALRGNLMGRKGTCAVAAELM
jgi:hypothetical protein